MAEEANRDRESVNMNSGTMIAKPLNGEIRSEGSNPSPSATEPLPQEFRERFASRIFVCTPVCTPVLH